MSLRDDIQHIAHKMDMNGLYLTERNPEDGWTDEDIQETINVLQAMLDRRRKQPPRSKAAHELPASTALMLSATPAILGKDTLYRVPRVALHRDSETTPGEFTSTLPLPGLVSVGRAAAPRRGTPKPSAVFAILPDESANPHTVRVLEPAGS